jgi:malate:Na+ symporter
LKSKINTFSIMGIRFEIFLILSIIVLTATYLNVLPDGMIGAFPIMLILGSVLGLIGDKTPFIKDYLGGGAIVIIFGSSALVMFNILPQYSIDIISTFTKSGGFLDFYIAALITGSILGMNRLLLIQAFSRYVPSILGGIFFALTFVGLMGYILGYGAKEAILYIGVPIMGGGMGAGAVPLSNMFSTTLGQSSESILSNMVPAVALGNAIAIVLGGLLDKLGKMKPTLSGNGNLMINTDYNFVDEEIEKKPVDISSLGIGVLISTAFFIIGTIVAHFIPSVHSYAWMIIAVGVVKVTGVLPKQYEEHCFNWFEVIMKNFTALLLVGIGVAYTSY